MVAAGCLADISAWIKKHHLQLNLAKTELLVFPATPTLQHDFTIQLGSSTITPSASVRNLGVIFYDQLTFKEHIAKTAWSFRFALHNIRKIRPFLMLHNFLSRPMSFPGWITAMLFWLDFHQTSTNDSECSGTTGLQRAQKSPCYTSLCLLALLPVAARIQFKTLMVAYRTTTGSEPTYLHPPTSTHYYESTSPPEVWDLIVSNASWYHHREAQNHSPEHSRSPFLAGGMIFPPPSGMLDPCQYSSNYWKLISFDTTWLHPKKKLVHLSHLSSLVTLLICSLYNLHVFAVLCQFVVDVTLVVPCPCPCPYHVPVVFVAVFVLFY